MMANHCHLFDKVYSPKPLNNAVLHGCLWLIFMCVSPPFQLNKNQKMSKIWLRLSSTIFHPFSKLASLFGITAIPHLLEDSRCECRYLQRWLVPMTRVGILEPKKVKIPGGHWSLEGNWRYDPYVSCEKSTTDFFVEVYTKSKRNQMWHLGFAPHLG